MVIYKGYLILCVKYNLYLIKLILQLMCLYLNKPGSQVARMLDT